NHHIHTYCKLYKKNLHYETITHDCTIGYGLRKIQPDMDSSFFINNT
ncbi:19453_t:CDS:1, partial [Funneliformis geosporum]